jgi:hypothetical protein
MNISSVVLRWFRSDSLRNEKSGTHPNVLQTRTAFIHLKSTSKSCRQKAAVAQHPGCNGTQEFTIVHKKPSNLGHSKESVQPQALSGISQTCCLFTKVSLLPQQPNSELEDHPLSADPVFVRKLRTRHVVLTQNTTNMERTYGDTERGRRQNSFAGKDANHQHFNASIQRRALRLSQDVSAYEGLLCDKAAMLRKGVAEHRRIPRAVHRSGRGRWC